MKIDAQKTLFLIDGSSFLYRAYYGLQKLHTPEGVPVQAVYGFCKMIKRVVDTFEPQHMALVWDSKGKTERHHIYPAYKATRQAPPSDLFEQKEYIIKFAELIGLTQVYQTGVEADDLMYSLARWWEEHHDGSVVIITSDKDMGQAITKKTVLYDSFKEKIMDVAAFEEKMGFPVGKTAFYFSLVGDSSDNIPGVKGIGDKGATQLVQQFDSLDDLYQHLDKVEKTRTRTALETHKSDAQLSLELFTLKKHKLSLTQEQLLFDPSGWAYAQPLFQELHFKTFLKELPSTQLSFLKAVPQKTVKASHEKGYAFIAVTTPEQLEEVTATIKKHKLFAYDTEGNGTNALTMDVVGLSICCEEKTSYYIPFGHITDEQQLSKEEVVGALKPYFEDEHYKKIAHHGNFDQLMMHMLGVDVRGLYFDTLIAASLVKDEWQKASLKELSASYLQEPMLTFGHVVTDQGHKHFGHVPLDKATEYAAADAHQTLKLYPILKKLLHEKSMDTLFFSLEMPLVDILARMEIAGVYCDTDVLHELGKKVNSELEQLYRTITGLIDSKFENINLNSSKQVSELLFDNLKLPPKKRSAKTENFATDNEVLTELAKEHPIPRLIIQYRELAKLKNTYIDGLPEYINKATGRIHTTYSQTRVATGRLASSDPNLQNIPVEGIGLQVRAAFKPQKKGYVFLSADYSQIELRVLAYLSQDKRLLDAFKHGHDIHAETASALFHVPLPEVTKHQRSVGKRINFSILYGLTAFGLSRDLNISRREAADYIDTYFKQYPNVRLWMDDVIKKTEQHGYTQTFFGRRRGVPGIHESNKNLKDLASRIAVNTVGQGTAAEIMKMGMIAVDKLLKKHSYDARVLLQIHDELLLEVAGHDKEKVEHTVKKALESVVDWNVPLVVETALGHNWRETD